MTGLVAAAVNLPKVQDIGNKARIVEALQTQKNNGKRSCERAHKVVKTPEVVCLGIG
jgi:hypothetical protein